MLWLANGLIVIGLWTLGYKWRHAFLFSIAGELIYTIMAYATGQMELAFICLVFCVLAFRNWLKWGNNEDRPNSGDNGSTGHGSGFADNGPTGPVESAGYAELRLPGDERPRRGVLFF